MTRLRLQYIHQFRDRHGKIRRYFRRPGRNRIQLPGVPGSDEFMEAYRSALAGEATKLDIASTRTKPGTVNAAIVSYYNSRDFSDLKPGTQKMRRAILERFRGQHGDKRIATLQTPFIAATLGRMKPFAARNWLKTLRGFLRHCVTAGLRADDPSATIRLAKLKTDGIHTWTETEIVQFEEAHAAGTRPRLAFALLLYTAQRRSDVIRMGRQHVRNGSMSVRQEKTGARLTIPLHPELQRILDSTTSEHLTFLVTDKGEPFTPAGFGNSFRDWCREARLPPECSAHGLRKAACRRLAEAGCTVHQIAAVSGHASLSEVQRYTKAADQARLAAQAMEKTVQEQTRTSVGKPQ